METPLPDSRKYKHSGFLRVVVGPPADTKFDCSLVGSICRLPKRGASSCLLLNDGRSLPLLQKNGKGSAEYDKEDEEGKGSLEIEPLAFETASGAPQAEPRYNDGKKVGGRLRVIEGEQEPNEIEHIIVLKIGDGSEGSMRDEQEKNLVLSTLPAEVVIGTEVNAGRVAKNDEGQLVLPLVAAGEGSEQPNGNQALARDSAGGTESCGTSTDAGVQTGDAHFQEIGIPPPSMSCGCNGEGTQLTGSGSNAAGKVGAEIRKLNVGSGVFETAEGSEGAQKTSLNPEGSRPLLKPDTCQPARNLPEAVGISPLLFLNRRQKKRSSRANDWAPKPKRKRPAEGPKPVISPRTRNNSTGESVITQLHALAAREDIEVRGKVLEVVQRGSEHRVVVLLDLYLPTQLWMGRAFWRPSPASAYVFLDSHLSTDWPLRTQLLSSLKLASSSTLTSDSANPTLKAQQGSSPDHPPLPESPPSQESPLSPTCFDSGLSQSSLSYPLPAPIAKQPSEVRNHGQDDWRGRGSSGSGSGFGSALDAGRASATNDKSGTKAELWEPTLGGCHVLGCTLHCHLSDSDRSKRFSLPLLFRSLALHTEEEPVSAQPWQLPLEDSREEPTKRGLLDLADDILASIFQRLDAISLGSVQKTCRHLEFVGKSIIPGLKLTLYPHQQAAVRWMLEREGIPQAIPSPLTRGLVTEDGFTYFAAVVGGELSTLGDGRVQKAFRKVGQKKIIEQKEDDQEWLKVEPVKGKQRARKSGKGNAKGVRRVDEGSGEGLLVHFSGEDKDEGKEQGVQILCPDKVPDFRGGLFCDEPGLGKTITALSLVLKTLGTLATAPAGTVSAVFPLPNRERYLGGYYEVRKKQHSSSSTLVAQIVCSDASGSTADKEEGKEVVWNTGSNMVKGETDESRGVAPGEGTKKAKIDKDELKETLQQVSVCGAGTVLGQSKNSRPKSLKGDGNKVKLSLAKPDPGTPPQKPMTRRQLSQAIAREVSEARGRQLSQGTEHQVSHGAECQVSRATELLVSQGTERQVSQATESQVARTRGQKLVAETGATELDNVSNSGKGTDSPREYLPVGRGRAGKLSCAQTNIVITEPHTPLEPPRKRKFAGGADALAQSNVTSRKHLRRRGGVRWENEEMEEEKEEQIKESGFKVEERRGEEEMKSEEEGEGTLMWSKQNGGMRVKRGTGQEGRGAKKEKEKGSLLCLEPCKGSFRGQRGGLTEELSGEGSGWKKNSESARRQTRDRAAKSKGKEWLQEFWLEEVLGWDESLELERREDDVNDGSFVLRRKDKGAQQMVGREISRKGGKKSESPEDDLRVCKRFSQKIGSAKRGKGRSKEQAGGLEGGSQEGEAKILETKSAEMGRGRPRGRVGRVEGILQGGVLESWGIRSAAKTIKGRPGGRAGGVKGVSHESGLESLASNSAAKKSRGRKGGPGRSRAGKKKSGSKEGEISVGQLSDPVIVSGEEVCRGRIGLTSGVSEMDGVISVEENLLSGAVIPGLISKEEFFWITCDECGKWRKFLPGCPKPDSSTSWFCRMNPDKSRADCQIPQEVVGEGERTEGLPGFRNIFGTDPVQGQSVQAMNIAFFKDGLAAYMGEERKGVEQLFRWLVSLDDIGRAGQIVSTAAPLGLGQLASPQGLVVPKSLKEIADSPGSPLEHLCLERRNLAQGSETKRKSGSAGKNYVSWHYPSSLHKDLVLDTAAMAKALIPDVSVSKSLSVFNSGPRSVPSIRRSVERAYLSSATLIVVPVNLVPHWLSQIQQHTYPGQLKVFVWTGAASKDFLPSNLAWDYDIVITTFSRLSAEWSGGGRTGWCRAGDLGPLGGSSGEGVSMLMRVHWLRVILDEGHTLGASLALTNKLQMAVALRAERRWILTGTPTPNTPSSQVAHIQPLLKFLHEGVFGEQQRLWELAIQRPFEAGREEGRARLHALLQRCMISALKSSIKLLPKCFRKVSLLNFSAGHAAAYNELVETVQRNILTADWADPDHVESLLNPKQWKLARELLNNVRLSCCVSGHMQIMDVGTDIKETMDMLELEGLSPLSDRWSTIQLAMKHGGTCDKCREWCRLPMVTPCRHLLCIACVGLAREHCTAPGCARAYKMQANKPRPDNPNPKWAVPEDLIELQPSYAQESWSPDWSDTSSSKVAYLIRQLQRLQKENEIFFHQQARVPHSGLPETLGREEKDSEKKFFSQEMAGQSDDSWRRGTGSGQQPNKAIVFSQFLEHISLVEAQLTQAQIRSAGMYSPRPSLAKQKALLEFEQDPECLVLLMDSQGSLGLDLSFASHVFLMEPIWDRSVEEQVIARAWRMGARRDVQVETLAMRGTIEEHMLAHLQAPAERGGARGSREMHDISARTEILKRLSFVRTSTSAKHRPANEGLPGGTFSAKTLTGGAVFPVELPGGTFSSAVTRQVPMSTSASGRVAERVSGACSPANQHAPPGNSLADPVVQGTKCSAPRAPSPGFMLLSSLTPSLTSVSSAGVDLQVSRNRISVAPEEVDLEVTGGGQRRVLDLTSGRISTSAGLGGGLDGDATEHQRSRLNQCQGASWQGVHPEKDERWKMRRRVRFADEIEELAAIPGMTGGSQQEAMSESGDKGGNRMTT